jgi:large subunit ribosomal protein L29
MSRASELREMTDEALADRLVETKDALFKIRFAHATGQQDETHRIGDLKRDIARVNTLMREREIVAHEMQTQE